jgi:outer membrane beta-barrel protein
MAASAWAEPEPSESAAVSHRLFEARGRWELGAHVGAPVMSFLVDTYTFELAVAYNPLEWLGVELRGGYALSRNNALAAQVAAKTYQLTSTTVDELSGTWGMGANGLLGVRFQPIYGKLNLWADLPVHFQIYLWVGGGLAALSRTSPMLCLYPKTSSADPQQCVVTQGGVTRVQWSAYLTQRRLSPLVSLALGMRLFLAQHHALALEVRSWSYPDAYYLGVVRGAVSPTNPTVGGGLAPNPGFTHLAQVELGYVVMF